MHQVCSENNKFKTKFNLYQVTDMRSVQAHDSVIMNNISAFNNPYLFPAKGMLKCIFIRLSSVLILHNETQTGRNEAIKIFAIHTGLCFSSFAFQKFLLFGYCHLFLSQYISCLNIMNVECSEKWTSGFIFIISMHT